MFISVKSCLFYMKQMDYIPLCVDVTDVNKQMNE